MSSYLVFERFVKPQSVSETSSSGFRFIFFLLPLGHLYFESLYDSPSDQCKCMFSPPSNTYTRLFLSNLHSSDDNLKYLIEGQGEAVVICFIHKNSGFTSQVSDWTSVTGDLFFYFRWKKVQKAKTLFVEHKNSETITVASSAHRRNPERAPECYSSLYYLMFLMRNCSHQERVFSMLY